MDGIIPWEDWRAIIEPFYPKKDASPAKAAEDIVQLAKAHDVAGFSARVTMSRIVPAAADAIKTV